MAAEYFGTSTARRVVAVEASASAAGAAAAPASRSNVSSIVSSKAQHCVVKSVAKRESSAARSCWLACLALQFWLEELVVVVVHAVFDELCLREH
jgi:hypothetical protein